MKDDFVSNMTHELKTPIAIAYSANDALLNYGTDNDTAKKENYLKIANKQLKRLGELVENILAMSMERRNTMQLKQEEIQLHPFIEEIVSSQLMRYEKEISIKFEVEGNVAVVSDKSHLANVLNNLIESLWRTMALASPQNQYRLFLINSTVCHTVIVRTFAVMA